jgi:GxxExxY protein
MAENILDAAASARDPQTYRIIGAAMAIHAELGCGFLEAVYQEAMAIELTERGIGFKPKVPLAVHYKGRELTCHYQADFICFDEIIVEIKALAQITGIERAQVINYLKATGLRRALLINFGAASLEFERIVRAYP